MERALAAARCDDCVVIAEETSSANLRWAGNTLTTNGVSQSRRLTVIAMRRRGDEATAGVVSRSGVRDDQVKDVVRAAEQAAGQSSPAEDAQPLLGPGSPEAFGTGGGPPGGRALGRPGAAAPRSACSATSPRRSGTRSSRPPGGSRSCTATPSTTCPALFLGTSSGLRLRHDQPSGKVELNAKSADLRPLRLGRARPAATSPTWTWRRWTPAWRSGWTGAGAGSNCRPAGTRRCCRRAALADLLTYMYWSAGAKDALDGRTVFSKAGGGTRVGERLAALPVTLRSDPAAPGLECAPFVIAHASGRDSSVFDNGLALRPTDWIRDGKLAALLQTRHTAELSGLPVTPRDRQPDLRVRGA